MEAGRHLRGVGHDAGALAGGGGALCLGGVVRGLRDGGRCAGAAKAPAVVGALQRAVAGLDAPLAQRRQPAY